MSRRDSIVVRQADLTYVADALYAAHCAHFTGTLAEWIKTAPSGPSRKALKAILDRHLAAEEERE
jgi:hypothetical protein